MAFNRTSMESKLPTIADMSAVAGGSLLIEPVWNRNNEDVEDLSLVDINF